MIKCWNMSKIRSAGLMLVIALLASGGLMAQNSLRVAMAQVQCINSDTSGNYQRIIYALEDAKKKNAQLVCFPETMMYMFSPQTTIESIKTIIVDSNFFIGLFNFWINH